MIKQPQLFLDCDGVLADFDKLATKVFGMLPIEYELKYGNEKFWMELVNHTNFYYNLDLLPDAMELYNAVKHLEPVILTGCKARFPKSCQEKRDWVVKQFGPAQKVIVCESKEKSLHMEAGDIIIDDFEKYKPLWTDKGGIWITHVSAKQSLEELKKYIDI